MNLIDLLMNIIELENIDLGDDRETRESLEHKINTGCIDFIHNKYGKAIGFFTWRCYEQNGQLDILLNNFVISKAYRGNFNILSVRKKLREKYKNINSFYWISRKKNKEISFKERE